MYWLWSLRGCLSECVRFAIYRRKNLTLAQLPQGDVERNRRVINMVEQMEKEGFGDCSNFGECEAVCPAEISISAIAEMRKDYARSVFS